MGLELKALSQPDLLSAMAKQLGLKDTASSEQDFCIIIIAAVLRRISASTAPCSRDTILATALDAFVGLRHPIEMKVLVCDVLDRLIISGDLLELGGTSALPSEAADDWLYCAPPTFLALEDSILLFGIDAEDQATLPAPLREQLQYRRELRVLPRDDIGATRDQLLNAGYYEVSRAAWAKLPQVQTAREFLDVAIRRLDESGGQGQLAGLKVMGATNSSHTYASRWTPPDGKSGYFVGRRPQAFGSDLWVFVELLEGRPIRFLDLPWRGGKFRGCDHGWRIQSALDAVAGIPQCYRIAYQGNGVTRYEFFSPLPLWAERQLRIHGEKVIAKDTLFAYELERQADHVVDDLLQSYMWFNQISEAE